jgi:hypothetical protein
MAGVTEIRRRAGEAWRWFRAFPLVIQAGAGVAVLVVVLAALGWLDGLVIGAHGWWSDRKIAVLKAEAENLRYQNAHLEGQLEATRAARNAALEALDRKTEEAAALAAKGRQQDANLDEARRRYDAARAGRPRRPVTNRDDLDRRLRELHPAPTPER